MWSVAANFQTCHIQIPPRASLDELSGDKPRGVDAGGFLAQGSRRLCVFLFLFKRSVAESCRQQKMQAVVEVLAAVRRLRCRDKAGHPIPSDVFAFAQVLLDQRQWGRPFRGRTSTVLQCTRLVLSSFFFNKKKVQKKEREREKVKREDSYRGKRKFPFGFVTSRPVARMSTEPSTV